MQQMWCNKYDNTSSMWQIQCKKCNGTNFIWNIQCDIWNVTNVILQIQGDRCNKTNVIKKGCLPQQSSSLTLKTLSEMGLLYAISWDIYLQFKFEKSLFRDFEVRFLRLFSYSNKS